MTTQEDLFQYRAHHILVKVKKEYGQWDYGVDMSFEEWLETKAGQVTIARAFLNDIDEYCGLEDAIKNAY